jgi:hypothetical protein
MGWAPSRGSSQRAQYSQLDRFRAPQAGQATASRAFMAQGYTRLGLK